MTLRLFNKIAVIHTRRDVAVADGVFVDASLPGETEIADLRVQFHVKRSLTRTSNSCDVTISNLSAASRADMERKPLSVRIAAGYDGAPRLLFVGDLRFGMTKQVGPDWETMMQLGDGDRRQAVARGGKSYQPGVTVRTILVDAAKTMGFELPARLASDPTLDRQYAAGYASSGPTRDELTRLLAPLGYSHSFQNGQLQILRDDEGRSERVLDINEEMGMIGTPEFGSPPESGKPPHVTVDMLLYPELLPGDLVNLTSKIKSGRFRVENVEHEGDTHGDAWRTTAEIRPVGDPYPRGKRRR